MAQLRQTTPRAVDTRTRIRTIFVTMIVFVFAVRLLMWSEFTVPNSRLALATVEPARPIATRKQALFENLLLSQQEKTTAAPPMLDVTLGWAKLNLSDINRTAFASKMIVERDNLADPLAERWWKDAEELALGLGVSLANDRAPPFAETTRIINELRGIQVTFRKPLIPDPVCIFMATDASDAAHVQELVAALASWGSDPSVMVYAGTADAARKVDALGLSDSIGLATVSGEQGWVSGNWRRILTVNRLRRRGSTRDQLRGRGILSLPLLYWMWQARDGDLQHCKWFAKVDSDSWINLPALKRRLSDIDAREPVYFGTPSTVDMSEYSFGVFSGNLTYALGGTGYFMSRGLLDALLLSDCFASLALDPVYLIHDDAGAGACAQYFVKNVQFKSFRSVIAATIKSSPWEVLRTEAMNVVEELSIVDRAVPVVTCLACLEAAHPLDPVHQALVNTLMTGVLAIIPDQIAPCDHVPTRCAVVDIAGEELFSEGFPSKAVQASPEFRRHQTRDNTFELFIQSTKRPVTTRRPRWW